MSKPTGVATDVMEAAETCWFTTRNIFIVVVESGFALVQSYQQYQLSMNSRLPVIAPVVLLYTTHD
jgi:hypothetical protein